MSLLKKFELLLCVNKNKNKRILDPAGGKHILSVGKMTFSPVHLNILSKDLFSLLNIRSTMTNVQIPRAPRTLICLPVDLNAVSKIFCFTNIRPTVTNVPDSCTPRTLSRDIDLKTSSKFRVPDVDYTTTQFQSILLLFEYKPSP